MKHTYCNVSMSRSEEARKTEISKKTHRSSNPASDSSLRQSVKGRLNAERTVIYERRVLATDTNTKRGNDEDAQYKATRPKVRPASNKMYEFLGSSSYGTRDISLFDLLVGHSREGLSGCMCGSLLRALVARADTQRWIRSQFGIEDGKCEYCE
jgi:hypothetical protein